MLPINYKNSEYTAGDTSYDKRYNKSHFKLQRIIDPTDPYKTANVTDAETFQAMFMEEKWVDIQPAKVDYAKGVFWLNVNDLLTITDFSNCKFGSARGSFDVNYFNHDTTVDLGTLGTQLDLLSFQVGVVDPDNIKLSYTYKGDYISATAGSDDGVVIKIKGAMKFQGFNSAEVLTVNPLKDGKRDDTDDLQKLANALYQHSTYDLKTVIDYSGITSKLNFQTKKVQKAIVDMEINKAEIYEGVPRDVILLDTIDFSTLRSEKYYSKDQWNTWIKDNFNTSFRGTTSKVGFIEEDPLTVTKNYILALNNNHVTSTNSNTPANIVKTSDNHIKNAKPASGKQLDNDGSQSYIKNDKGYIINDTLSAAIDGVNVGKLFGGYTEAIPPTITAPELKELRDASEGAYLLYTTHMHDKNTFDRINGKWAQYSNKMDNPLISFGKYCANWPEHDNLEDDATLGTKMSNITFIPAKDANGNILPNQFYDNSGNIVNLGNTPEAERTGALMMGYYSWTSPFNPNKQQSGYFSLLCP